jgi:hypothetical protein
MKFKKPDVKAPRHKPKATRLINKEFMTKFMAKHPQYKGLSETDFRRIISSFNTKIYEKVIEERDGIELPSQLGFLFIGSCKVIGKRNYSYGKSTSYETSIRNTNLATDGLSGKIFYSNYPSKYRFAYRALWAFKAYRDFSRSVHKTYPEKYTIYREVENTRKISQMFDNLKRKEYGEIKDAKNIGSYNDFEL